MGFCLSKLRLSGMVCLASNNLLGGTLFKTGTFSGVRTLAGYADTSKHGRVRFVIALRSNDSAMRFRLLKAIQSGL